MRPRELFRGLRLSMGQPGGPRHICLCDPDFLADGLTKRGIPRGPRGLKNDISMVGRLYKYKKYRAFYSLRLTKQKVATLSLEKITSIICGFRENIPPAEEFNLYRCNFLYPLIFSTSKNKNMTSDQS